MGFLRLIAVLGFLSRAWAAVVNLDSSTIEVGGISYFVPGTPVAVVDTGSRYTYGCDTKQVPYYPFTVISTSETVVTETVLSGIVANYTAKDDVFSEAFLAGIYIDAPEHTSISSLSGMFGASAVFTSSKLSLPPGPYFVSNADGTLKVFKAFRIYPDTQRAFVYGTIQEDDRNFTITSSAVLGYEQQSIAVPSRLYYTPTAAKPLAGYRVGIKDIYDIAGLKTGCGNRAFFQLYPAKAANSFAVDRLVQMGAIIVGKTLTSQFANGESSTADWVDQFCPFNPRGDGYQDPSSSSSGSGASMGAYDWLDFAIGSDTGGSIRGPAGQQGLFGIRPSHGAISLTGVMPLSSPLDTAGFFARNAHLFNVFANAWYGDAFKSYTTYPKTIYNGLGSITNPAAAAIFASFVSKLTAFVDGKQQNITLATLWNSTKPAFVTQNITTYLNTTYPTLIGYEQATVLGAPFNATYQATFSKRPFFDPVVLVRWAFGLSQGAAGYQAALTQKETFKAWWNSTVLIANETTCSNAIYVYPQSTGSTQYRNVYFLPSGAPTGFSNGRISVYTEIPDIVVPIGQVPYNSTITGRTEYLPVTISLMAAKGCDYMLLNLIEGLSDAGIISGVKVGATAF